MRNKWYNPNIQENSRKYVERRYLMDVKMFDVVQVDFGENIGSEQSGMRPSVVFQSDEGNKHSPTVLVIPLTKGYKKLYLPTHNVIHRSSENGLNMDSTLLGEGIRQVDKKRILYKRGSLSTDEERNAAWEVFLANATGKRKCSIA